MDNSSGQVSCVQAIENGKGLQFIIDEAYKILGNPLVLFNMEYELMFWTKNVVTDDWLWNEIVSEGIFSEESIKFFLEEYFIDGVANTKSIALLTSDKLRYERLYGRIFNCYNNTVADLIMVACNKPFEDNDPMVFEAVCEKISREISTDEFYNNYGIIYHDKLICKLLDADIDNKMIYSGHISNLYEELKANLYVVVADISACNAKKNELEKFRDLFKEMHPEFKYAVYINYIVIITSVNREVLNIKKDLHKLYEYFNDNNICIGVSSRFDNLFNLRKYYNEAVSSLKQIPKGDRYRRILPDNNSDQV